MKIPTLMDQKIEIKIVFYMFTNFKEEQTDDRKGKFKFPHHHAHPHAGGPLGPALRARAP